MSTSLWQELVAVPHCVRFIETAGGIRTRVLEAGDGHPIVLLHGTGGHLEVFLRNIASLSRSFRVVAIDLLGHGLTDLPREGEAFDWRSVSEHVLATLDALAIDSAIVVGEALGAQAAQWLAVRAPERIDKAILCCACIPPAGDRDETRNTESLAVFQDLTRRVLDDPTAKGLMRERMAWLHLSGDQVNEEMLDLRSQFWSRAGFTEAHRRLLGSLRTARNDSRTALSSEELSTVRIPVLMVWTDTNPLQGLETATRVAQLMPAATVVTLTNSAMWPQFDESETFNNLIISWLDSLDPAGRMVGAVGGEANSQ